MNTLLAAFLLAWPVRAAADVTSPQLWDRALCAFETAASFDSVAVGGGASRCPAPAAAADEQTAKRRQAELPKILPPLKALQGGRLPGESDEVVRSKVELVAGLFGITDGRRIQEITARYTALPPGKAAPTAEQLELQRLATQRLLADPRVSAQSRMAIAKRLGDLQGWRTAAPGDGSLAASFGQPNRSQAQAIRDYLASGNQAGLKTISTVQVPAVSAPDRPASEVPLWHRIGAYAHAAKNFFSFTERAPVDDTYMIIQSKGSPLAAGKTVIDGPGAFVERLRSADDGTVDRLTLQGHGIPGRILVGDTKRGMEEMFVRDGRILIGANGRGVDVTDLIARKVPAGGTIELMTCNSATKENGVNLAAEVSRILPGRTVTGYAGKIGVNAQGSEKVLAWGYKNHCREGRCDGRGTGLVNLLGAESGLVPQLAYFDVIGGSRDLLAFKQ